MTESIERRLELWEITYESADEVPNEPPLEEILRKIQKMPFQVDAPPNSPNCSVRELRIDNDILGVDFSEIDTNHIVGIYGKGRDVDVPDVRKGKRRKKIPLKQGEYIEYPSHFIVFDDGLTVFERNPAGPSPATLGAYIQEKCPDTVKWARVDRVPRGEFLERFKKVDSVRSVILRLGIRGIQRFARSSQDDLWTGLEKEQNISGFESVTLRFSMSRRPGGMKSKWFNKIPEILANSEASRDILRMEINARMQDSGEIEVIRLLKHASIEKTVRFKVLGDNKSLDSDEVYREIHNQFSRFKRILEGREDERYLDVVQETIPEE